ASGSLSPMHYPGRLSYFASAKYYKKLLVADPQTGVESWETEVRTLPLEVKVMAPDGQLFTADHITLADIRRYRDLRGVSQGTWTYSISGASEPIAANEPGQTLAPGDVHAAIGVQETVTSQSAPPLVDTIVMKFGQASRFDFDL